MRNFWSVAGAALAFGCAMGGQETKKSETRTAQDQAHQSLQQAADAQKKAADEQAKVEQFQQNVTQKQKELADAQAQLRGQMTKAEQAQRDAQQATRASQQEAQQQQQTAMQTQRTETQQMRSQNQQRTQSWTQEQDAKGTLVTAGSDQLQIRTEDKDLLKLQVTDSTAVTLNGQTSSASQLQPGSDVRASYQMVDGQAKALKIDATSKSSSSQPSQQK
jgi:colicin import membrane protein